MRIHPGIKIAFVNKLTPIHYSDVIMSAIAFQTIGVTIIYSTVCSSADQRKHQSSASLVISSHKGPVTRKIFAFDDVILIYFATLQLPAILSCTRVLFTN